MKKFITGWDVRRYRDYPSYFQGYRAPQPPDERTGWIEPEWPNDKGAPQKIKIIESSPIQTIETAAVGIDKKQDSISEISQEAFLMDEEDNRSKPEETKIPFAMIALTAITGLFLIHRIKS
jgi:hypothetical protein